MLLRTAALALGLTVLASAPAGAQVSADPAFLRTEVGLLARAQQRVVDQAASPEHARRHAERAPRLAELQSPDRREDPAREAEMDPFLDGWSPARGVERDVSITNRYGARMHGHLSMPKVAGARLPAVILLTGGAGSEHGYRELAYGLAEADYVVLGLNVQGDLGSQSAPADPDPSTPDGGTTISAEFPLHRTATERAGPEAIRSAVGACVRPPGRGLTRRTPVQRRRSKTGWGTAAGRTGA